MAALDWRRIDPRLLPALEHRLVPRRFALWREVDRSGVSGRGLVALGAQFPSGACVLEWQAPPYGQGAYRSLADVLAVHGHGGDTVALWFDKEEREHD